MSIARRRHLWIVHLVVYAMFGAMMLCSKLIMEGLPNIHPIAMFVVLLTVVYRKKALIPIYIFVVLDGLRWGFGISWIPYLYVWTLLWVAVMLLPQNMSDRARRLVYPAVSAVHGLLFGLLYAPAQAALFGLTLKQTAAWVVAGLPYDLLHAAGNAAMGLLVLPMSKLLVRLESKL